MELECEMLQVSTDQAAWAPCGRQEHHSRSSVWVTEGHQDRDLLTPASV